MGESPGDTVKAQSSRDLRVLIDVVLVVVVNEFKTQSLAKDEPDESANSGS